MSVVATCPECQRRLQVPESFFGRKVRCPDCKHAFVAQPPAGGDAPVENTGVQTSPAPPLPQPAVPAPQEQVAEWDRRPEGATPSRRRPRQDETDDDDDGDDDEEVDDRPRRIRRRAQDKSTLILTLGITGVSLGLFGVCCNLFVLAGLGVCITGWVMGQLELSAMRAGKVSDRNRSMVMTGWVLSMVGVGLCICWLLFSCALIGLNLSLNGRL